MKDKSDLLYANYLKRLRQTDDILVTTTPKIINNWLLDFFTQKRCHKILDVGFGTGLFIKQAKNRSFKVYGIEANQEFVKESKKNGLQVKKGNINKIPFPNDWFDGVHCAHVVEHLTDPTNAFLEIFRVLRKSGWLILVTPRFNKLFYDDWTHLRPFTTKTLQELALATGFKRISVKTIHLPFLVKYYRLPPVYLLNQLFASGIPATFLTWITENFLGLQRSILLLTAQK